MSGGLRGDPSEADIAAVVRNNPGAVVDAIRNQAIEPSDVESESSSTGVSDVREVSANRLYNEQQPEAILFLASDGNAVAVDADGVIDDDPDPAVVLESIDANLSRGGDVFVRSGRYDFQTNPLLNQTQGIKILGEGAPWRESDGTNYGTVFRGDGSSAPAFEHSSQFTSISHVAFDANGCETAIKSNTRDAQYLFCGFTNAEIDNVRIRGPNIWMYGCWNEFAGVKGIDWNDRDLFIHNCLLVRNGAWDIVVSSKGDNLDVKGSRFANTESGLKFQAECDNTKVVGNTFRGIGYESVGATVSDVCAYVDAPVTGQIAHNTVNSVSTTTGVAETKSVVHITSATDASGLDIGNNSDHGNLTGPSVQDNGVAGYTSENVKIKAAQGSAPDTGVRFVYRRDLSPPELRAVDENGTSATVATF